MLRQDGMGETMQFNSSRQLFRSSRGEQPGDRHTGAGLLDGPQGATTPLEL
jgi:hypothetical protein